MKFKEEPVDQSLYSILGIGRDRGFEVLGEEKAMGGKRDVLYGK